MAAALAAFLARHGAVAVEPIALPLVEAPAVVAACSLRAGSTRPTPAGASSAPPKGPLPAKAPASSGVPRAMPRMLVAVEPVPEFGGGALPAFPATLVPAGAMQVLVDHVRRLREDATKAMQRVYRGHSARKKVAALRQERPSPPLPVVLGKAPPRFSAPCGGTPPARACCRTPCCKTRTPGVSAMRCTCPTPASWPTRSTVPRRSEAAVERRRSSNPWPEIGYDGVAWPAGAWETLG